MAFADFFRSLWKRPAPPPVVVEPAPVIETKKTECAPEPRTLLGVRSSQDVPRRVSFLEVLRTSGAFTEEEVVAFGREFVRLALAEPGPVRLRDVAGHALFFGHDGSLGGAMPSNSFAWMAPEVAKGHAQTERTDVYVVGLVMYAALLGDVPVQGDSDMTRLYAVVQGTLVPLAAQPSTELSALVRRCLTLEPSGRFASLEEVAAELQKLEGNLERLKRRAIETWDALGRKPLLGIEPMTVPQETEAQLLSRMRLGDESARSVYADHLEATGRTTEAEWLRLEQRLRTESSREQFDTVQAMRKLSVSPDFMASVSRAELEACGVSFGFRCPRTWDALGPTEDPLVRYCNACEERVYFASDIETAERLTFQGRCVAVADAVAKGDRLDVNSMVQSNYVGQSPIRRTARKR